ncbi:MAG: hypothetical protein KBD64_04430 [Gammaproteobacteria bacterium]|nr:hypothetical protein [Gammaproteobacteria bacterium]
MSRNSQKRSIADFSNLFTWPKIKDFLAKSLSFIILIVGALTSATAGFKAIPVLLSFYPFNLIAWPAFVITAICWATAISGFTAFYGGYEEHILGVCYRFIDWVKNLILRLLNKDTYVDNKTPIEKLEEAIKQLGNSIITLSVTNKNMLRSLFGNPNDPHATSELGNIKLLLNKKITESELKAFLAKYEKYLTFSEAERESKNLFELYQNVLGKIHSIYYPKPPSSSLRSESQKTQGGNKFVVFFRNFFSSNTKNFSTPSKTQNTYHDKFVFYLKNFVKILSCVLIVFGCTVVIGMGVLTNQGFLIYYGISQTNLMMFLCFTAATLKQMCQMAFAAVKQHATFCSFFGASPKREQQLEEESKKIHSKNELHGEIEKVLLKVKKDFQEIVTQSKKTLEQPINNIQDLILFLTTKVTADLEISELGGHLSITQRPKT